MSNSVMQNPRLVELLVQRAVDGLNSSERAELKQLLSEERYVDAGRFEYTAASLLLAADVENNAPEEMPYSLRERLMAQADTVAASMPEPAPRQSSSQPRVISIAGRTRSTTAAPAVSAPPPVSKAPAPRKSSSSWGSKVGWFAAAASVLIALAGWWPRLQSGGEPTTEIPVASTLEQERQQLLAQQGVMTRTWQTTQDPAASGVTGDVVWDQRTQNGYLRFRGLQANNADELQYQLWIFDGTRDDRYPIDGGVFDIPPGQGEVIIPITAKLQVRNPAMFAVTIEKAGGSVVSSRDRIVVLAPVAAG
ncbi:anti-sigma factor domain-containing protein [Steroidobacter flavus]|uniref:Anti-sigma factor domain-containing protein n=1 Tax=Steroidobacter flavus TaxID=1842136 RepID=A0ABV8SNP8_9GAMM